MRIYFPEKRYICDSIKKNIEPGHIIFYVFSHFPLKANETEDWEEHRPEKEKVMHYVYILKQTKTQSLINSISQIHSGHPMTEEQTRT